MASMVASLDRLRLMIEPKSGEERVDGLTHKICEERADGLTHKICEERADELTIKIDGERVGRLTRKIREERADGLDLQVKSDVEQMLVDGDGSESGGCNLAQVTPSTELQECAIPKWEELMTWVEPVAMASMWRRWWRSMASMVVASMASMVAWWRRWRRMVDVDWW